MRETRAGGKLSKVHYLRIEPGIGVVRVREDDYETGTRTWLPYELRVVDGPYGRTLPVIECEPGGGQEHITQVETIVGTTREDVLGQTVDAEIIEHRRVGDVPARTETSWYVRGIGEVRQRDQGGNETVLIGFEPGFGDCP